MIHQAGGWDWKQSLNIRGFSYSVSANYEYSRGCGATRDEPATPDEVDVYEFFIRAEPDVATGDQSDMPLTDEILDRVREIIREERRTAI